MLIICEDCAKKYNIDDSRIRGNRARFTCKACGHIIIVNKSDTTRPLISSASTSPPSSDDSGTIDLLKEMEASSMPDTSRVEPGVDEQDEQAPEVKSTPLGKPVFTYIFIGILVAFICISGALGYIYTTVLKGSTSTNLLGNGLVALGIAWVIVTAVFFVIARSITKPLIILTKDVHRICQGERNIHIVSKGPREIRELANGLSKLSNKLS
jgi:predicted Zn finger-like uncharacterized protein